MTGLAALINPDAPDAIKIQVFYNTDSFHLGLKLQAGDISTEDGNHDFKPSGDTSQGGFIIKESSLAATTYLGTQFVVAVTSPKKVDGQTITTNDISVVSPIYLPIAKVDPVNTSLALCSTGKLASLFYLGGNSPAQPVIQEYKFIDRTTQALPMRNAASGTALCAYFDGDRRNCIYQDFEGWLRYYNGMGDALRIPGSDASSDNTPLALVYLKADDKLVLYFTGNRGALKRLVKTAAGWGDLHGVPNASPVAAGSQLTAVNTNVVNHIFYITGTNSEIAHTRDPLDGVRATE